MVTMYGVVNDFVIAPGNSPRRKACALTIGALRREISIDLNGTWIPTHVLGGSP